MKTIKVILLLFLMFNCGTKSQSNSSFETPESIIEQFFLDYRKGQIEQAIIFLFSSNEYVDMENEEIKKLKSNMKETAEALGTYYDEVLINKVSITDAYVLYSYMVKYDRQPLRFSFLFYKANDKWRMQNFSYDDELGNELEEARKAYRLPENLPPIE